MNRSSSQPEGGVNMLNVDFWTVFYTVAGKRRKYITVKSVEAADAALTLCVGQYGLGGSGMVAGKSVND